MNESGKGKKPNLLLNKNRWQKQWQTIHAAIQQSAEQKMPRNENPFRSLIDDDMIDEMISDCYACFKVAGNETDPGSKPPFEPEKMMALIKMVNVDNHQRAAKRHQTTVEALSVFATAVVPSFLSGFFDVEFDAVEFDKNRRRLHDDVADHQLTASENDPKDFMIGSILRQISTDILHLQQTMHLRVAQEENAHHFSRQLTHTMAEVLARRALKPVLNTKLLSQHGMNVDILTYPTSGVRIRSIPYRDTLLIGFPITAFCDFELSRGDSGLVDVTVSTDYLTLAHEVGHFIYRFGCPDFQKPLETFETLLNKKLEGKEIHQTIASWQAELFSDVYSCLVEGPIAAVGFQELLESEDMISEIDELHEKIEHKEDEASSHHASHSHPPAIFRPFIFTQILRLIAKREKSWRKKSWDVAIMADMLDENWLEWLEKQSVAPDKEKVRAFQESSLTEILNIIIDELMKVKLKIYEPDREFKVKSPLNRFNLPEELFNIYCLTCAKAFLGAYDQKEQTDTDTLAWFKIQFEARRDDWMSKQDKGNLASFVRDGGLTEWLAADAWSDDGPTGGHSGRG